jgi:DNA-binding FrmR family transcriptional regulator
MLTDGAAGLLIMDSSGPVATRWCIPITPNASAHNRVHRRSPERAGETTRPPYAKTGCYHTPLEYILDVLRPEEDAMHGYTHDKDDYAKRLRRIEGQVRGLAKMIENDEYCIDVLTQVSATTKALQSVALGLLDEHLRHCVTEALSEGGDTADEKVREASAAIARLVRS